MARRCRQWYAVCMIVIKRIYEVVEASDGYRVLIDRLWPRGVRREAAALDHWAKAIAPSTKLRQWYNHLPELWPEFQLRYRLELAAMEAAQEVERLRVLSLARTVTLLTATRNETENHAIVLRDLLIAGP
jgi:uncharacterized protein YeaO (DUF488 family)